MAQSRPRRRARNPSPHRQPAAEAAFTDGQRRLFLALLAASAALTTVTILVPPRGGLYWLLLVLAILAAALFGHMMGGQRGRWLERRLFLGQAPAGAWSPPGPGDLPPNERAALLQAMLPALLAQLAGHAEQWPERQREIAMALRNAAIAAWTNGEARGLLAAELPLLMAALPRSEAAIAAAERLTALLAEPDEQKRIAWRVARQALSEEPPA